MPPNSNEYDREYKRKRRKCPDYRAKEKALAIKRSRERQTAERLLCGDEIKQNHAEAVKVLTRERF